MAGASEEVFDQAVKVNGETTALERSYNSSAECHMMLYDSGLSKRAFIAKANEARDSLKHLQKYKGPTITVDLEEAACWMLVRATNNGHALGFEFNRYQDFEGRFYENIVGI